MSVEGGRVVCLLRRVGTLPHVDRCDDAFSRLSGLGRKLLLVSSVSGAVCGVPFCEGAHPRCVTGAHPWS
jgi:hypothetical protein